MTPEHLSQATRLEADHRRLLEEVKRWQNMHESPAELDGSATATRVPAHLWLALKNGMVVYLQGLVESNRRQFAAL